MTAIEKSDLDKKIIAVVDEQLGLKGGVVTHEKSFIEDLGADSLDMVELVMAFEETFKLEIPDSDAEKIRTVGEAIAYITERVEKKDKE